MTKFFQDQRSAIAPVGIVAVVSMNTIMKKNKRHHADIVDTLQAKALGADDAVFNGAWNIRIGIALDANALI